ncbi:hypothetical protein O1D97_13265 [Marinomonas sp. 15G1-11]|uniref:VOC domain-containing protein n=1 Tax=Marinomonas phaeophyticola TaxID=3004091 RepID=A0ABT4JWC8_9GAMM|nr:hypothetical protein [Marinomonas sp. 15G1-11]MCZ2722550.1 hypothetical protein [Marinomonas sp. 15G1-11]
MYIDHINISAPKDVIEQEKVFLMDVFDLLDGKKSSTAQAGYWLYYGEQAVVHLTFSDQHAANEIPRYLDHVAFRLTNFDAFVQKLVDRQVQHQIFSTPETGERQVFFHTPSGIRLEANFSRQAS